MIENMFMQNLNVNSFFEKWVSNSQIDGSTELLGVLTSTDLT